MKNLFLAITAFTTLTMFAQKTVEKDFKFNGRKKKVKIFIPKSYEKDTVHKYPIAVVLNDQYLFDLTKGNSKLFAGSDIAPNQIVVGIPTDPKPNQDVSIVKQNAGLTRNSKAFYNFIKKDILTYLKATYKTSPFKTIVAQGKAANFATYFLSESKPVFNAYICITPKLNSKAVSRINSYSLNRLGSVDNTYFLYLSSNPLQKKKSKEAFANLEKGLGLYKLKNFNLKFDNFEGAENAVSTISESIPRAYSQIFALYRNISKQEFEKNIKDLAPLEAIKYLEQKYIDIDYLYGTNTNVRVEDFYAIEGIITDQQDGDYLRVLGDFALIKHPNLPLGDYYMGKFYELGKQYQRANDFYKAGYGKMNPSDPNADGFYQNIARVQKLLKSQPKQDAPTEQLKEGDDEE